MSLLAAIDVAIAETEEHKKAEAAKDDDNWDSSAASDDANEKSAKLDDSNWDEEDEDDAKKDAKSPQEKYAVTDTSKLDETKESNWDSSVAEEEEKAAEGKPETQNVLDETQESKWDSSDDDEKQEEEGHTGKKEEGFQLFDDLSAPPPKPVASAAEKVGLLSEEDDDDDDEEEEDKKEEAKEKVGLAKKGASEKKEEKEEGGEEDQTEKEKDKEEEEEKEKEKEKAREKEKEELKAREQEKEEKKQKEKEEKKEKEKEEKRKEKEMAKEKEKEAAKEKAKEGKEEKEEEFELFDDISAPKPGTISLSQETLPPLPINIPMEPEANMKLSSMLATNHGITVNKENPLLLPEEKEEEERSASDILFQRLPDIKTKAAYRAPKVPVKEDEFEEVLEKAAPLTPSSADFGPPKLEVRETSTGLMAMPVVEEGMGVLVAGPPGSMVEEMATRLADLLGAKLIAAPQPGDKQEAKKEDDDDDEEEDSDSDSEDEDEDDEENTKSKEKSKKKANANQNKGGTAATETTAVERVLDELPLAPKSFVVSGLPGSVAQAEAFGAGLGARSVAPLTALLLLGGDTEDDVLVSRLGVVVDEDGEEAKDADFDEEAARRQMEKFRGTAAELGAHYAATCFQVDADGSEEELWDRVQLAMSSVLKKPKSVPKPLTPGAAAKAGSGLVGWQAFGNGGEGSSEEEEEGEEKEEKKKDKKALLKEQYDKDLERETKEKEEKKIIGDGVAGAELGAIGEEEEEEGEESHEISRAKAESDDDDDDDDDEEGAKKTKKAEEKSKEEIEFEKAQKMWDAMPSQEIEDKSHIGFVQQTTVPEAREYVLRYEDALTYFRHMDRTEVLSQIRTHSPPVGCMAVFMAAIMGPKELATEALIDERELVLCVGKTGMGQGKVKEGEEGNVEEVEAGPMHLRMLQTSFASLTGDKEPARRMGSHWERIGFQGTDPSTDLRDLGMFSVLQLLWLATTHVRTCKTIFRFAAEDENEMGAAGHGFPFAVSCISFSKICLEALRCGSIIPEMNRRGSVVQVLNDLYLGLIMEFYKDWRSKELSIDGGHFQLYGMRGNCYGLMEYARETPPKSNTTKKAAIEAVEKRAIKSPAGILRAASGELYKPTFASAGGGGEFADF